MTIFRIKPALLLGLMAIVSLPSAAQTTSEQQQPLISQPASDGRDASFMPPGPPTPLVPDSPVPAASSSPAPAQNVNPPVTALSSTTSSAANVTPAAPSAPTTAAATTTTSAIAVTTSALSVTTSAAPPVTLPATTPALISKPVESSPLKNIDPATVGTLTNEAGGLGATMWKGTPRELVEHLLSIVSLPNASLTLDSLAQRLLLTSANVPEGTSDNKQSLTALRLQKLIALGDAADAWTLAWQAKNDQVDEVTLRTVSEAALVSSAGKDVCAKIPDIIKSHTAPEWQELLITCQLRDGDTKAAQLALDVMHTQDFKDDVFFQLAERNIIGGAKALPRQLTPLKPITVALLQISGLPLPSEIYSRADAAVTPLLIQAKARDDKLRLALAERAAARGIISASQLADAYRNTAFPGEQLSNAINSIETGPRLRALLYQAAQAEKTSAQRFELAIKFIQSMDAIARNGVMAQLLATMIGDTPASSDQAARAATATQIYILAGRPKEAASWLKIARQATDAPDMAVQLQDVWPMIVLSGIESDSDYNQTFPKWLDAALRDATPARREQIGNLLLVFETTGFAVPENAWTRVIDTATAERRTVPPSILLLQRLRAAAHANRRGETVLLALTLAGAENNQLPLIVAIETIRALKSVGLGADALSLARETASLLLLPPDSGDKR